jgi:dihydroorotase
LVVIDPASEWQVDPSTLASRSRNTPYIGVDLKARVRHTVFEGQMVVKDGVATA